MNLLKKVLLTLIVCLISGCSGSKMEPIDDQGTLLEESGEGLILDDEKEGEGGLTLDDDVPNMPVGRSPNPVKPTPLKPSRSIPEAPPAVVPAQPLPETPVFETPTEPRCPTCPQAPPVVAQPPCHRPACHPQTARRSSPTPRAANDIIQTKVVFVVDTSSHNYRPSHPYVRIGSDLNAQIRTHFIRQFVEERWRSGWFAWSMITFLGTDSSRRAHAVAPINAGRPDRPVFTKSYENISAAINRLETADGGREKTNYKRALELTKRLIEMDSELWHDDVYYQIFFITGTRPWDSSYDRVDELDNLYENVREIINIRPGRVFLSTAYYGLQHNIQNQNPSIPNVADVLKGMAEAGDGDFFYLGHSYDMQGGASPCQAPTSPCHQFLSTTGLETSTALALPHSQHQRILQYNNSQHLQPPPLATTEESTCPHGDGFHPPGIVCPYVKPPCTQQGNCSQNY